MSALEQIRQQGFELAPAGDEGLYIEPIDELTDMQRLWLVSNKPQIRRQLFAERWQWFISLATEHGIHPHVAEAEFPTEQDRLDVVEPATHTDDKLHQWMATLCADVRVRQRQQDYTAGRWVPVDDEVFL